MNLPNLLTKRAIFSSSSSSQDSSSEDEGSFSWDDDDDEKMSLFVKRFGMFMVKKSYRARREKSSKSKDEARRCFKCGSKDNLVAQCPYNSDNDDDDKKSKKKDKKEKKENKDKMTFKKKKKGSSYVVT